MPADPVAGLMLDAYLDGELDLERRLAVEDHLVRTPALAMQVIADMRARTALRLAAAAGQAPVPAAVGDAARRLAGRLDGPARFISRGRLAAAAMLAAMTFGAATILPTRDVEASPPEYVSDAVMAYRTGILRRDMASQPENTNFDPAEVYRATRIRVPTLPDGWRLTDVQVVPDDDGPALQLMAHTARGETVSIFAIRGGERAPARPTTIRRGNTSIAYWRHNDIAYALTGLEAPAALAVAAEDLADNRLH
jgi:anti-sigma factor RsiW